MMHESNECGILKEKKYGNEQGKQHAFQGRGRKLGGTGRYRHIERRAGNVVQQTAAPVNPQKPQAPVEKVASAVQDRTAPYETRKSPLPDTETTERRLPKVKLGSFGPSISRLKQGIGNPAETSQPAATPATTTVASQTPKEEENYPVTEDNIRFCWHEFINLPCHKKKPPSHNG